MIPELMNTEFTTKDLHLASYLKVKQIVLLRIDKPRGVVKAPSLFVFKDKDRCQVLEKKFWEEGDYINVKDYVAEIRDLRSRVLALQV